MDKRLEAMARYLVEAGNIDLNKRPVVRNKDGSISTVASFSFQDDSGAEVLIPMVAPNGTMFPSEDAAINHYYRTGQHLGKFTDWRAADAYAQALHTGQERQYAPPPLPAPPKPMSLVAAALMGRATPAPKPMNVPEWLGQSKAPGPSLPLPSAPPLPMPRPILKK